MSGFMVTPVNTITRYVVGDTPQDTFVVPFPFDDIEDLLVTVDNEAQIITLSGTVEVEGFYTSANVVLAAPVTNAIVFIQRKTVLDQQVKYPQAGSFRTAPLNSEVSRLWMALQDMRRELDFTIAILTGGDIDTIIGGGGGSLGWTPNALLNTIINTIVNSVFPPGVVVGWAGFVDDLPEGWALCDGTNGTPNMADKFVVAAGPTRLNNSTGGQDVRDTEAGGDHAHGGNTGLHVLTVEQIPPHAHSYVGPAIEDFLGSGTTPAQYASQVLTTGSAGGGQGHRHAISESGAHVHSVTVVPAFYALAFIMRVGLVVTVPSDLGDVGTVPTTAFKRYIPFASSDETTALTVATNLIEITSWLSMTATKVKVSLRTASISGAVEINVRVGGVVMTAAPISLGVGVKVVTATVLSETSIAENDLITVDVVSAGSGAAGLKIAIEGNAA